MNTITVGPEDATRIQDLTELTIDGVTFRTGDEVWLTHVSTGERLRGTLGRFFGVGRVRGIKLHGTFVGETAFYFGKPQDEVRILTHVDQQSYVIIRDSAGAPLFAIETEEQA